MLVHLNLFHYFKQTPSILLYGIWMSPIFPFNKLGFIKDLSSHPFLHTYISIIKIPGMGMLDIIQSILIIEDSAFVNFSTN